MLQPPPPEAPSQSVGCKYCVVGHVPTWQPSPAPGEYVHVIQKKSENGLTTQVSVAPCTAFRAGAEK
jgi:hypothetical protein